MIFDPEFLRETSFQICWIQSLFTVFTVETPRWPWVAMGRFLEDVGGTDHENWDGGRARGAQNRESRAQVLDGLDIHNRSARDWILLVDDRNNQY